MATISTGKFVWFEYFAKDLAKAKGYLGELFNWKTTEIPTPDGGTYTLLTLDGQSIGGLMTPPPGAPDAMWLSSLQVADARIAADKIKALGGNILKEPIVMGDMGTYALVADPQGAVLALWQGAKPDNGDYKGVTGSFCWNELLSHDPAASISFYTQLGFEVQHMEMAGMGTYHTLNSDGKPRAGVIKKPMPDAPQAWLPYVQVASADQTVDKAKRLGATVYVEPTSVPTVGRFAVIADSQGGALGVLQPETK